MNEHWVSAAAPMSALQPVPDVDLRIRELRLCARNRHLGAQFPDISGVEIWTGSLDALYDLFGRFFRCRGFPFYLHSLKVHDEPKFPPSSMAAICIIGADAGESEAIMKRWRLKITLL